MSQNLPKAKRGEEGGASLVGQNRRHAHRCDGRFKNGKCRVEGKHEVQIGEWLQPLEASIPEVI